MHEVILGSLFFVDTRYEVVVSSKIISASRERGRRLGVSARRRGGGSITNPMKEHTDNNFRPLPVQYLEEFAPYRTRLIEVFRGISEIIRTGDFTNAEKVSAEGKWLKKEISNLRRMQTHRLQQEDADKIKVAFVYLNLIQESHELLSEVRNVLRGCEKYFIDQTDEDVEEARL